MSEHKSVFKAEQERSVLFRGKEIATADLKDGKGYVSVRSFCDAFGLGQRAQRRRLQWKKKFLRTLYCHHPADQRKRENGRIVLD